MSVESNAPANPLDRGYFENLARFAPTHWWHLGRRELAAEALGELRPGSIAVDAGCGIGSMLPVLGQLGAKNVVGVEPSEAACRIAARSGATLLCGTAEQIPLASGTVDTLVSMDVVEHLADDVAGLREYARLLAPGGRLLLQVPAYSWLWSSHDELVGHHRRYTAPRLRRVTSAAGLEVIHETYYNAWLLPLAFLFRRTPLRRLVKDSGESASYVNPFVNRVLMALARLERRVLRRMRVPFGVSVLLVARKPDQPSSSSVSR